MLKMIVPPLTKLVYPETGEKIEYLDLNNAPKDILLLDNDAKEGNVGLRNIKLTDADYSSRVVVIKATRIEQALMAVVALENKFRFTRGDEDLSPESDDDFYKDSFAEDVFENFEEEWTDENIRGKIPIIYEDTVNMGNRLFGFGLSNGNGAGFSGKVLQSGPVRYPFYYKLRKSPIIIVQNEYAPDSVEILENRFGTNEKIYYLSVSNSERLEMDEDGFQSMKDEKMSKLVIFTDASVFDIRTTSAEEEDYSEVVLRQIAMKGQLTIKDEFDVRSFVRAVLAVEHDNPIAFLNKVVNRITSRHEGVLSAESCGLMLKKMGREKTSKEMLADIAGLDDIKAKIEDIVNEAEYASRIKKYGIDVPSNRIILLQGPPGTAKSTFARIIQKAFMERGLLRDNRYVEKAATGIVGQWLGETPQVVSDLFMENSCIFLDEFYSLLGDDDTGGLDLYSKQALATMMPILEAIGKNEYPYNDKLVILAGYAKDKTGGKQDMKAAVDANPGLRSRISTYITLRPYTSEECTNIFFSMVKSSGFKINGLAKKSSTPELLRFFDFRLKDAESFGNGRGVRILFEKAIQQVSTRVCRTGFSEASEEEYRTMKKEDILSAIKAMDVEYPAKEREHRMSILSGGVD